MEKEKPKDVNLKQRYKIEWVREGVFARIVPNWDAIPRNLPTDTVDWFWSEQVYEPGLANLIDLGYSIVTMCVPPGNTVSLFVITDKPTH